MNRLVLIDGNAVLHRAYHAIPPLTAPDGSIVNAVYGFATMLVRLIGDLKPTHVAVAFDRAAPTFRKKLFSGYQMKRPKIDDALIDQIPKVHDLVTAFGIPIFEKDGFEADDVIGTLVNNAKCQMLNAKSTFDQVIIVTGDRDILQLVEDEKILVYMPTKGLSEAKLYDEKAVAERMGVTPAEIPDFKSLAGDASDNYPGVEGVGPKTAVDLLKRYGSLEGIYRNLKDPKGMKLAGVSAGVIAKLEAGKESALMGKDLATIRQNVPLEGGVTPLEPLNRPEAAEALTRFGFRTLLKRIIQGTGVGEQSTADKKELKEENKKEEKPKGQQQVLF